ncbi:hypothetical protein CAC42_7277 [Sphaceloma murrayae]|uniref:AHC1-like C2H2 zinc-finger domain-containing protein n=1 Tax=Sphaceloma murrayae TaxID=2082308 RepID=A0A2K1QX01_9PEZI|nr:hypothetical protein CAC42_7277 [Sphaceloma murrayae]
MHQAPVVDLPLFNKLKRKRSESSDFLSDVKRKRPCETDVHLLHTDTIPQGSSDPQVLPVEGHVLLPDTDQKATPDLKASRKMDDGAPLIALVPSDLSPLQQTIQQQFNLEILMKHREIRLIEQELAKCQIALEQLRRCELIPYPGQQPSLAVSAGIGPAIRTPSGFTQPAAPAPWGVTDGPYSKHYSSWLLPDSTFDPVSTVQTPSYDPYAIVRGDRSTRNSGASWAKPVKSRHNRESVSSFPVQSPAAPAPARNKGGPLVLKRLSDNQFVKLVCTKCHRSDFSSVQGFLNHCRIAHKIDYKSHEAAAQDCGHPLEDHEADLAATAPPPVGTTVRTPAPKPLPPAPITTRVHHLNQEFIPRPTWKRQRLSYIQAINRAPAPAVLPATPTPPAPLVSTAAAPFLSSHLARRGIGVNLAAIIAKLGEKIDLGPEEDADDNQSGATSPAPAARMLSGKVDRPASRKGFHASSRPRQAPAPMRLHHSSSSTLDDGAEVPESPQEELSPHTADSNPGLVSDHEDDPASDPEETGSVIVPEETTVRGFGAGCGEMEVDVQVEEDGHGVVIREGERGRQGGGSSGGRKFGRRE